MRGAADDRGIEAVLAFWFAEGPDRHRKAWFRKDPDFDREIRDRFGRVHRRAAEGRLDHWAASARGLLALIVVLDQFSRNLHRDDPRAFACDAKALALARDALDRGVDRELGAAERGFVYMPFQHSEDIEDQRRSVALFEALGGEAADYARRHLEVIERYGRFPGRNAALGRASTPEEREYLRTPGAGF